MVWIYEQKDWPDFRWDSEALSVPLADLRHRQGRLLGRMEALGFNLKQEASLNTLTNDIVKTTAIEGEALNPDEVRSSIARRLGLDVGGLIPAGRNVEGIVEIMIDATRNFKTPLTQDRLFNWHAALFPTGRSGMLKITVANWRKPEAGAMQVVSGAFGKEIIHFEAPKAESLKKEMSAFLKWFEGKEKIDPVLKSAIAHLWFVTIHPFEDGNGRIARAIADMALSRADNTPDRFYSMSAQIEVERKIYYRQLEEQQKATTDITQWLDWFLGCLGRALDTAEDTLSTVLYKDQLWARINKKPVNDRQRLMINRMLEGFEGHMSTSKYAKLAKCSNDTALRDIQELETRHILVRNDAGGRSTSYNLAGNDDIKDIL